MMSSILAVDDEVLNRELLSGLLGKEFNILTVASGEEAIEVASREKPDLILLDILMPGIDGYETCEKLKQNDVSQNCPVIFISANKDESEILRGYEAGAVDYLVKPFKPKELKQKVRLNLDRQKQQREWEARLSDTNMVALQAMTDTSIYGSICQFYVDSLKCNSYDSLVDRLFTLTSGWELKCTLQVHLEDKQLIFFDSPVQNPIEEKVLSASVSKGRIFDFGERTIINSKHCSLLIKNMPLDDPARYGAFKDYLAFLADGLEGRIEVLIADEIILQRTRQLQKVFLYMLEHFRAVQTKNYQLRSGSAEIVEQMMEDLQLAITEIGSISELNEAGEKTILHVGEECVSSTNTLFSRGLVFVEKIEELIEFFEKTLAQKELSDDDLKDLLNMLEQNQVEI